MTVEQVPPGLVLIVAALLLPFLRGRWRAALVLLAPIACLWLVWQIPDGAMLKAGFLGLEMIVVKGDRLSRLFGTIFCIMAFAGGLFALRQARTIELTAALFYAGSAIGVVFAGDLITVFVFWELMALGSTIVIWSADTEASRRAGMRYVMIHLLGGVAVDGRDRRLRGCQEHDRVRRRADPGMC